MDVIWAYRNIYGADASGKRLEIGAVSQWHANEAILLGWRRRPIIVSQRINQGGPAPVTERPDIERHLSYCAAAGKAAYSSSAPRIRQ